MSPTSIDQDIAIVKAMVDGPDSGLADYLADRSYLRDADQARDDLARLLEGLEDSCAGRVVPHATIIEDMERRRRGHRTQAAE